MSSGGSHGSGMTMVLATHEMAFARDVATKVAFLDEGVVCEQGAAAAGCSVRRRRRVRRRSSVG